MFKTEKLDTTVEYQTYNLNLDKVNTLDDCKKILSFLCKLALKPTPVNVSYNGFSEVQEYFKNDEKSKE